MAERPLLSELRQRAGELGGDTMTGALLNDAADVIQAYQAGEQQSDLLRGLPLPREVEDELRMARARELSEASVELGAVIEEFQRAGHKRMKLPPSAAVHDVLERVRELEGQVESLKYCARGESESRVSLQEDRDGLAKKARELEAEWLTLRNAAVAQADEIERLKTAAADSSRVVECAKRLVKAYQKDGNGVGVRSCEDSLIEAVAALEAPGRVIGSSEDFAEQLRVGQEFVDGEWRYRCTACEAVKLRGSGFCNVHYKPPQPAPVDGQDTVEPESCRCHGCKDQAVPGVYPPLCAVHAAEFQSWLDDKYGRDKEPPESPEVVTVIEVADVIAPGELATYPLEKLEPGQAVLVRPSEALPNPPTRGLPRTAYCAAESPGAASGSLDAFKLDDTRMAPGAPKASPGAQYGAACGRCSGYGKIVYSETGWRCLNCGATGTDASLQPWTSVATPPPLRERVLLRVEYADGPCLEIGMLGSNGWFACGLPVSTAASCYPHVTHWAPLLALPDQPPPESPGQGGPFPVAPVKVRCPGCHCMSTPCADGRCINCTTTPPEDEPQASP